MESGGRLSLRAVNDFKLKTFDEVALSSQSLKKLQVCCPDKQQTAFRVHQLEILLLSWLS